MISLIRLENDRMLIAPFFDSMDDVLVSSYLQGHMGEGWVDSIEGPSCAQIRLGDFSIVAGNYKSKEAAPMVMNIPEQPTNPWFLIIPQNEGWCKLIEECYPERSHKLTRYALKKDTRFSLEKLQANVNKLDPQYSLASIDKSLYGQCLRHSQLRDLCSHFLSAKDYVARGLGFCILHGKKVVCGASSYAVYDDGIEIEVDTIEDYRRQGLATICASRLILECLQKGKYPKWDAASQKSLVLAEKLGYEFSHEYSAYAIEMT